MNLWTVQYPTTGQVGTRLTVILNYIGRFKTEAAAKAYIARVRIAGAIAIPYRGW